MDTDGQMTKLSVFRPTPLPIWLLAAAHLPSVWLQVSRLWSLEYYQFFPFAFVAFAALFRSRVLHGEFRWDRLNTVLIVCDVLLLTSGALLNSPWLVYAGGLSLCLAVCRSYQDSEYECSLSYLFLLPLITLRLPLQYDVRIIQWLQSATTRISSLLLNHFGFLHLREGNVLVFPGKRFLVEEACSGVQSLFTVLFVACLIICIYRRKWLHGSMLLVSGFAIAGLMNVLRICAISIAWSDYQTDLSTGWQHGALGNVALAAAAFLVVSSDALLGFVFEPVPDARGSGVSLLFRNPLIAFWNLIFYRRQRDESVPAPQHSVAFERKPILITATALLCVGAITLQLMSLFL